MHRGLIGYFGHDDLVSQMIAQEKTKYVTYLGNESCLEVSLSLITLTVTGYQIQTAKLPVRKIK